MTVLEDWSQPSPVPANLHDPIYTLLGEGFMIFRNPVHPFTLAFVVERVSPRPSSPKEN